MSAGVKLANPTLLHTSISRQLGVSEHRLRHRTVEVWNKCDLIALTPEHEVVNSAISGTSEASKSWAGPLNEAGPSALGQWMEGDDDKKASEIVGQVLGGFRGLEMSSAPPLAAATTPLWLMSWRRRCGLRGRRCGHRGLLVTSRRVALKGTGRSSAASNVRPWDVYLPHINDNDSQQAPPLAVATVRQPRLQPSSIQNIHRSRRLFPPQGMVSELGEGSVAYQDHPTDLTAKGSRPRPGSKPSSGRRSIHHLVVPPVVLTPDPKDHHRMFYLSRPKRPSPIGSCTSWTQPGPFLYRRQYGRGPVGSNGDGRSDDGSDHHSPLPSGLMSAATQEEEDKGKEAEGGAVRARALMASLQSLVAQVIAEHQREAIDQN